MIGTGRASGTRMPSFCAEAVAIALDAARTRAIDIDAVVLSGPIDALAGCALQHSACPILRLDAVNAVPLGAQCVRAGQAERLLVLGISEQEDGGAQACALVLAGPWTHAHGDGVVCLVATLQSRGWPRGLSLKGLWSHDVAATPGALPDLEGGIAHEALLGARRHALDPRCHGVELHGRLVEQLLACEGDRDAALTCIEPAVGALSYSVSLLRRAPGW